MPLTDEQKAAKQDARRLRDRAHRARYKTFRAAEEAAVAEAKALVEHAALDADAAEERLLKERDAADAALKEQIAALERQREKNRELFAPQIEAARQERHETWSAVRAAEREAQQKVLADFPDMAGNARWSAASWACTDAGKTAANGQG